MPVNKKIKSSLYKRYVKDVVPKLQKESEVENIHEIPGIEKVIVNMGLKKAVEEKAVLEEGLEDMTAITGQKPVVTKAKKSISNFDIRKGDVIGCKVTLRGERMYDFLNKTLRIALPRIRDFSGIKRSIDDNGNLTIGIKDETIYPEINSDKIKFIKGLSIGIVTSKQDKQKSERMYELLNFPFKEQ
ncbi:MAG: 50S ribosomal protein L5 [Elusimicrobiota bacterium]